MAAEPKSTPSFSRGRRWGIIFNVVFAITAVIVAMTMLNYLSTRYFTRVYLDNRTRIKLSTVTVNVVRAITNDVNITLYYDRDEDFYDDILDLAKQYQEKNPRISIQVTDYYRDPGIAQQIKDKYNLGAVQDKNLIIFDCEGKVKVLPGEEIVSYTRVPDETEPEFRKKPVQFNGEVAFTSALLALTSGKPFTAYFLEGHGEHRVEDTGTGGYAQMASVLQQNYVQVRRLSLLGTNTVPDDCDLLVIAGPTSTLSEIELERIEKYLNEGKRMLALFNFRSAATETGLEKLLLRWGVSVGADLVVDPDFLVKGRDIVVSAFSRHPAVFPLYGDGLYMTVPRPVRPAETSSRLSDLPKVEIIAASSEGAYLAGDTSQTRTRLPIMVAVEKASLRGVSAEGGGTRMIVAGDSAFLSNELLKEYKNREFVGLAVNWLLDRRLLIEGLGARPVTEYRMLVTAGQMRAAQWILLCVLPGGILMLGGLVWLRRRR